MYKSNFHYRKLTKYIYLIIFTQIFNDWINVQNHKTKRDKLSSLSSTPDTESIPSAEILYKTDYVVSSKKQKKKQKKLDNMLSSSFDINFDEDNNLTPKIKKSLSEKFKTSKKIISNAASSSLSSNPYSLLDSSVTIAKKKKKKNHIDTSADKRKKMKNIFFVSDIEKKSLNDIDDVTVLPKVKKHSKNKKRKQSKQRFLIEDVDQTMDSGFTKTYPTDLSSIDWPTKEKSLKCKVKLSKQEKEMKKLAKRLRRTMKFGTTTKLNDSAKEKIL